MSSLHIRFRSRATFLIAIIALAVLTKYLLSVHFSTTQGRFSVPPIPDDIAYFAEGVSTANRIREDSSLQTILTELFRHHHSPILNIFATTAYLTSAPQYLVGSGDWSGFYLPNKLLGLFMLSLIPCLYSLIFRGQRDFITIIIATLVTFCFSWTGGLITEYRPDLPCALLLASGTILFTQRIFRGNSPLFIGPLLTIAALYAKPTTFIPIIATGISSTILTWLCWRLFGRFIEKASNKEIYTSLIASAVALVPFACINLIPTIRYVYRALVTDSRIWSEAFKNQGLAEKFGWYFEPTTGGGSITSPLNNQILIISVVCLLAARLAWRNKPEHQGFTSYYHGYLAAIAASIPYYALASISAHKGHFIGSYIGIILTLLFSAILATLLHEATRKYGKGFHALRLTVVVILGVLMVNTPPFESFWWPYGYPISDSKAASLHRNIVDQTLAQVGTFISLLQVPKPHIFVASKRLLHGELVRTYLISKPGTHQEYKVISGETVSGKDKLKDEIEASDIIVFEPREIAKSFYNFDLYTPSIQRHLRRLESSPSTISTSETKDKELTPDGGRQGIMIFARISSSPDSAR
jgi:hypothetical protein